MTAIGGRALRDALRRHPYHVALAALAAGLAGAPAPLELAFAVAGAPALMLALVGRPAQAVLVPATGCASARRWGSRPVRRPPTRRSCAEWCLDRDEAIAAHVREDFRRAGLAHLLTYRT